MVGLNVGKDVALTSLETVTAFDITTGAFKFVLDEMHNFNISQSEDTTDIVGKLGRKFSTLKRNKAITISGTNGLISAGLLETQTGGTFESKATPVMWAEYLTVKSAKATTTYKAIGTVGAEIEEIYVINSSDNTLGTKLVQAGSASSGKFAYAPGTKEITFHSDITDGTEVVVRYKRSITAEVLDNTSDKLSGKAMLYVDGFGEDTCGNIYRVQIYIPKASFSGEFSFDMGDTQALHSFSAEALGGACGTAGTFFTYTIFKEGTVDA